MKPWKIVKETLVGYSNDNRFMATVSRETPDSSGERVRVLIVHTEEGLVHFDSDFENMPKALAAANEWMCDYERLT